MYAFYHDQFVLPLPCGHRFPMSKYRGLREALEAAPWGDRVLLATGPAASEADLALAHASEYLSRVIEGQLTPSEIRRLGFPWSPGLVERSRRSTGSTIAAVGAALADGAAANLAGGTHHAFADQAEGYCVFNDAVVAARVAQRDHGIRRVAVVDCDVHQGNGTAALGREDATLFTFSIHGAHNFPFHKVDGDLDIALPDGTGDEEYLEALDHGVGETFRRGRPDLVIYLAGADPFEGDKLGRLSVSKAGLAERDRRVFSACRERGVPVAVVMAGGYATRVEDTVDIHVETVRQAVEIAQHPVVSVGAETPDGNRSGRPGTLGPA